MSQDSPVGFALLGIGRAGHIHANNLIRDPQVRLKYIVDIDEDKAKEFVKSNYLDTKVVPPSAMETVLRDKTVTATVIATPTHLHEDLILSCLKAGKAVFCEKPIATTAEAIGRNFITRIKLRQDFRTAPFINYIYILRLKLCSHSSFYDFWKRVSMTVVYV